MSRRRSRAVLAVGTLLVLALAAGCAPVPILVALAVGGGVLASGGGHGGSGGGPGGSSRGEPGPPPGPVAAPAPFQPAPAPAPAPSPSTPAPTPSPLPFVPASLTLVAQPSASSTTGVLSPAIQVLLRNAEGQVPAPGAWSVSIALGANPGGARLHGTTTVAVGARGSPEGAATFGDLVVDSPGTGYTLVASLVGGTLAATTDAFDVSVALPTWLAGPTTGAAESAAVGSGGLVYFTDSLGNVEALDLVSGLVHNGLPPPPSGGRLFARLVADVAGRIYLLGGEDSSGPLGRAERFDPDAGTWTTLAPLPTPRSSFGAALGADGKIYALGGRGSTVTTPLDTAEVFDVATGTWASLAPLPTRRRWNTAAATLDGRVLAIGGFDGGGGAVATTDVLTLATGTWATGPTLAFRRVGAGAAMAVDGTIHVVGGDQTAGAWGVLATAERLAPGASSWTVEPSMTRARAALGVVAARDGRIVAIGGFDPFEQDATSLESLGPTLAASATSGAAGSSVVLTGTNFGPSASLTVTWGLPPSGSPLGTGTTDATGTVSPAIQVTVPSVAPGSYTIAVHDPVSGFVVASPYVVPGP